MSLSSIYERRWTLNHIDPQSGVAFTIRAGQLLKIVDPRGKQVCDLFCYNADDKRECLSVARSIDYADSILLSTGNDLYSNRSNKMLTIESDTCGRHDCLMPPCSLKMFQIVSGTDDHHKSCLENLSLGFKNFKFSTDDIGTCFNIFMNVSVSETGALKINAPLSKSGDSVLLRAQQNLIIGLTACSHEETNDGICKPIEWEIVN